MWHASRASAAATNTSATAGSSTAAATVTTAAATESACQCDVPIGDGQHQQRANKDDSLFHGFKLSLFYCCVVVAVASGASLTSTRRTMTDGVEGCSSPSISRPTSWTANASFDSGVRM